MHGEGQSFSSLLNRAPEEEEKEQAIQLIAPILSEALVPELQALFKKKKIKKKDGSSEEEFTVTLKRMKALQNHEGLDKSEKAFLKENQLKYHMMQYKPGEGDEDDEIRSIDSLSDRENPFPSLPPRSLKGSSNILSVSPDPSERDVFMKIIKKVASSNTVQNYGEADVG